MMSPVLLGGVGEIRTLASLTTPNDLANRPLQPLEYHSTSADLNSIHWQSFYCQDHTAGQGLNISQGGIRDYWNLCCEVV